jgi:uncharacterized protein (TIGR00369 family)
MSTEAPKVPGFWSMFGYEIERADGEEIVLRMRVPDALMSPFGSVHGGVIAMLFDTGLAIAVSRRLAPTDRIATHNLNVSFVSFTSDQALRCRARVVSLRSAVAIVEGEVVDSADAIVAKAMGTFGVRRK